jgi:hypothetical protein
MSDTKLAGRQVLKDKSVALFFIFKNLFSGLKIISVS